MTQGHNLEIILQLLLQRTKKKRGECERRGERDKKAYTPKEVYSTKTDEIRNTNLAKLQEMSAFDVVIAEIGGIVTKAYSFQPLPHLVGRPGGRIRRQPHRNGTDILSRAGGSAAA